MFGIAQPGLDIYRAVRGKAINEVNNDRQVVAATITSPEAQWQKQKRYHQQGESVFMHWLLPWFKPTRSYSLLKPTSAVAAVKPDGQRKNRKGATVRSIA
jgi:hypothetical protein